MGETFDVNGDMSTNRRSTVCASVHQDLIKALCLNCAEIYPKFGLQNMLSSKSNSITVSGRI